MFPKIADCIKAEMAKVWHLAQIFIDCAIPRNSKTRKKGERVERYEIVEEGNYEDVAFEEFVGVSDSYRNLGVYTKRARRTEWETIYWNVE